MPPQAQRSAKRPGSAAGTAPEGAPQQGTPNLLEQLRRESGTSTGRRDIIPIPAVITVFAVVWLLVVALMHKGWTDNFNSYLARARQNKGDYAGALAPMGTLAAKYPDNSTYQAELAQDYYQIGQYDKAVEYFTKAQALEDSRGQQLDDDGKPLPRADFNTMIGRSYFQLGDMANAEKHLQKALKRDRLDKFANLTMGELEIRRKDFKKAMSYLKVVAADPAFKDSVKGYYDQIEKELFAKID